MSDGYWYTTETPSLDYQVRVEPPPADEATARIHKHRENGPVAETRQLQTVGSGVLAVPLGNYTVNDSPLFVQFIFRRHGHGRPFSRIISIAEPVPKTVDAPAQARVGDRIQLRVSQWAALSHDHVGRPPTEQIEDDPSRISADVKQGVKWRIEWTAERRHHHVDLTTQGEQVDYTIDAAQEGVTLTVYAYVGDHVSGRARAQVRVAATHAVLALFWKDPGGQVRGFPENVPFVVEYDDHTRATVRTNAQGRLAFDTSPGKTWFTLRYDTSQHFIASAADDSAERFVTSSEAGHLMDGGWRAFMLPAAFGLVETDWEITEAPSWQAAQHHFELHGATLGTDDHPVVMKLDPHWQFVRFEFFDRFYGPTDHGNHRIGIPAVPLAGFRSGRPGRTPHTKSNWTVFPTDATKNAQALPWIIQHHHDGSADAKPDEHVTLEFRTPSNTFVVSTSGADRRIERVNDAARRGPSADRLKLYDLPPLWRSKSYFARPAGGSPGFFERLTTAQVQESLDKTKPLVFSLDDIVLTDENRRPIALAATSDPAIFFHAFSNQGAPGGATISAQGLYKPGSDPMPPTAPKPYLPFSAVTMPNRHYLSDYPDWTRLVVAEGNLFDVFADRTHDDGRTDVVGARAAVRFVNLPAGGPATGTVKTSHNHPSDKPFFAAESFFTQEYDQVFDHDRPTGKYKEWIHPFTYDPFFGTGRYDMALLRCCGVDSADPTIELAINVAFFRFQLDFNRPDPDTHPPTAAPIVPAANQAAFRAGIVTNIPNRWNSPDAMNADQTFLVPQSAADKVKVRVFWFVQDVPHAKAHYKIDVNQSTANARAFMSGDGTGRLGPTDAQANASGWFTAAHENGHGYSLPDEYNERWSDKACSYERLSFRDNLPGDPFVFDQQAIMVTNKSPRPRHYWHAAEWVKAVTRKPMQVERGGNKLRLPSHARHAPYRTYAYTPLYAETHASSGTRGSFHLYLYHLGDTTVGTDPFRTFMSGNGTDIDGLLLVVVKMRVKVPAGTTSAVIKTFLNGITAGVNAAFNRQWVASGNLGTGRRPNVDTFHFDRALIHCTPRFLVETLDTADAAYVQAILGATPAHPPHGWPTAQYAAKVNAVDAHYPKHFFVNADPALAASRWHPGHDRHRLDYQFLQGPGDNAAFATWFGDMVGIDTSTGTAIDQAHLKSQIVDKVLGGGAVNPV